MGSADINYLAVLVSGVAYFMLGGLWYSPVLFANPWMKALGLTEEKIKEQGSAAPAYIVSVIGSLVSAYFLANFVHLTGTDTLVAGLGMGFSVWLGFVVTTSAPPYFYEDRPKYGLPDLHGVHFGFFPGNGGNSGDLAIELTIDRWGFDGGRPTL